MGDYCQEIQEGLRISTLEGSVYSRNKQYVLKEQDGDALLCNDTGCIKVDDFVASVWKACENKSLEQIYEHFNQSQGMSSYLLETTLKVLVAADLVRQQDRQDKVSSGEKSSKVVTAGPLVSIVIVNFNGKEHLETLIPSIAEQTYQNIETIVVDNGSTDLSVKFVKGNYSQIRVLALGRNYGFAAGNNRGIEASKGDYVLLLNNDTRLDPHCVEELIRVAEQNRDFAAISPKMMLFNTPRFINSMGNIVSPHTWGSDNFIGYLDLGQFDHFKEVFSACFGAALIKREVLGDVGLLDEDYRFYYEDADWCYRARLKGYRIITAPQAIVYHKFGASMATLPGSFKLGLAARNRLRFALKNMEPVNSLWLIRNYVVREDLRNLAKAVLKKDFSGVWMYLRAWFGFALSVPKILFLRLKTQRTRLKRATDRELFKLVYAVPPPQIDGSNPILSFRNIRSHYIHTKVV